MENSKDKHNGNELRYIQEYTYKLYKMGKNRNEKKVDKSTTIMRDFSYSPRNS